MAGKQVYLTEEQLWFLIAVTDACNALEDDKKDEVRAQIHDKLLK